MYFNSRIYFIFIVFFIFAGCNKDQTWQEFTGNGPSQYTQIEGIYNVYDSLNNFLYEMNLIHKDSLTPNGNKIDSLQFIDLDGQFNFTTAQSGQDSNPDYFVSIGYNGPLYDSLGNRWKIIFSHDPDGIYDNTLRDDTIRFIFKKVNINYYLEDLVPYLDTTIRVVAVKQ